MSMQSDLLMGLVAHPHGGVAVDHRKTTKDSEIVTMPPPKKVQIPVKQHVGVPGEPVVKVGDEVYRDKSLLILMRHYLSPYTQYLR